MNDTTFQSNGKVTYVPVVVDGKPHKQTNADRIRAMSDEELAEWIVSITEDDTEGWLDWLRQEAKDD
jgi:hypothetical protein